MAMSESLEEYRRSHTTLEAWKEAIQFVTEIYVCTAGFPKNEQFGLVAQLRRAAVSVPSNLAEGAARKSKKEFLHFASISRASLSEIETQLIIATNLGFIDSQHPVFGRMITVSKLIQGLINYLEKTLHIQPDP
jgi:four helix bundle protein